MIPEKPITFAIHTIGCKTNQAESDDIARQLVLRGCHQVEIPAAGAGAACANVAAGENIAAGVDAAGVNIIADTNHAAGADVTAEANDATGTHNHSESPNNSENNSEYDIENDSYSGANDIDGTDYIIINTCTVTAAADRKARHLIRKLKNANPKSKLIVTGCFAELNLELIKAIHADFIFSNSRKNEIADFVCREACKKAGRSGAEDKAATAATTTSIAKSAKAAIKPAAELLHAHSRAFVKIQDGCQQGCSYCIVPLARGPYLSTDPEKIIADIKNLVDYGHDEVVLTGIHIGKFGVDLLSKKTAIKTLSGLVLEILKSTGLKRLRLSSIEINEIDESLIGVIRNNGPRVAPHLHIPLQSGSDNVLKAMNRKYDGGFFISTIEKIKKAIPDIALTTDIIAGFPGETGQDFMDTFEMVKNIEFSRLHVFKYSKRFGTKAADMPGQVQENLKTERSRILRELGLDLRNSFVASNINKKLDVVCEEYDMKNGIASGTSQNYIKVYFHMDFEGYKHKKGKILEVSAKSLYTDGLYGEVI